jgi:hypothetical protein
VAYPVRTCWSNPCSNTTPAGAFASIPAAAPRRLMVLARRLDDRLLVVAFGVVVAVRLLAS